ncbi:MAG: ATP-binding cassette domain-containing protein [Pseudonocardiaceae bacterium]|nr:ATP-binding cassette domain-containing protein [Pseudonocardiaceae bacterium]
MTGTRSRRCAVAGAVVLGLLVTIAVLAPLLAPYDPTARAGAPFATPSATHPLGTNDIGQDLLSELIHGARISLIIGIVAALAATVVGTAIGVVAGYARGWLDEALMRLTAILLEASLAFLGLGDITAKSWGTMLSLAQSRSAFLTDAWLWWVLPPGVAIALTVLSFALLGYAFEERARPALRDQPVPVRRQRAVGAPVPAPAPLVIDRLTVAYGDRVVVDGVSVSVEPGELVGLVGESGSGKSTVAGACLRLLPAAARVTGGRVLVCGHDVTALGPSQLRALRGRRIGLIPQEAMSALNPVRTLGDQLGEALTAHGSMKRAAVRARVAELLGLVALDPCCARDYPHQLSGGMRQRAVIAIALACEPEVLIADEPTSGLDILVQADVLDLLDELRQRLQLAVLVVSHDLPVIERIADRIAVMRAGTVVELGPAAQLVTDPVHPYTRRLVEAAPRLRIPADALHGAVSPPWAEAAK